MKRIIIYSILMAALFVMNGVAVIQNVHAAEEPKDEMFSVTIFNVTPDQLFDLKKMGIDIISVEAKDGVRDKTRDMVPLYDVEAVVWSNEKTKLERKGYTLKEKIRGKRAAPGERYNVYRSYDDPDGGIQVQLNAIVQNYPSIARLETIGYSLQQRPILAVSLSAPSDEDMADSDTPKALFVATHHAREWASTEMAMRLLKYLTANYETDEHVQELLEDVDIWIIPVANPDGYEYTFTDYRLWRKNLRDNDGDGVITRMDGVDLNRNFDGKWGYDNEGSSAHWEASNYRGTAPNSEPETVALVELVRQKRFKSIIAYHTQGNLILYPEGWQNMTRSLDDPLFLNQAGDDTSPAIFDSLNNIPYNPGVAADLYITNGEIIEWAYDQEKIPTYVVELTKGHGFEFPDDESMLETLFEDNLSFALRVAESTVNPFKILSPDGKLLKRAYHSPVKASHGTDQIIEMIGQKDKKHRLYYRINGGKKRKIPFLEKLGRLYNNHSGVYFTRFEATVKGQAKGDRVDYWIDSGDEKLGPFGYTVDSASGNPVLVVAAEDYSGDLPPYEENNQPNFLKFYEEALKTSGYAYDVWDVSKQKNAPAFADVLSHYKAVIWYTGNDIDPTDPSYSVFRDTYLHIRDFLNVSGGKLLVSGQGIGNILSTYPKEISDDFFQYYLGAYRTMEGDGIAPDSNTPYEVTGKTDDAIFGGLTFSIHGGDGANNQSHPDGFLLTPSFLPHFEGELSASYSGNGGALYPHSGDYFVYSENANMAFKRLGGTFDIPESLENPELSFWISYDTESQWDYAFVEVAEAGSGVFTTLSDENGLTVQDTGKSCKDNWVGRLHPFLGNYMDENCNPYGKTGSWNAFTGDSAGWKQVRMDLSSYSGKTIELYFSYATDWGTLGFGVFLDDIAINDLPIESFEEGTGMFTPSFAPPNKGYNNWKRIFKDSFSSGSAIRTSNTVFLGFGFEAIDSSEKRAELMKRVMMYFNVR